MQNDVVDLNEEFDKNSDVAVRVKNLKKIFRFFKNDYRVFYWLFTRKGFDKEFRVLDGLTFDIKRGERVGILGKNGAGKSTLLKIISGIYFPSSGEVEVYGKIASLIELGAGFREILTGRENIYMKGSLMGMTKSEVDSVIDEIIEFADIGEYFDMPLGTYSSGMKARLGFALAVNTNADILIIDEVFAVGDRNFQNKSRAKTEELLKSGKTVLFVSHSGPLIEEFCDRVIYLKDGHIEYDGEVHRGLGLYESDNLSLEKVPTISFKEYDISQDRLRLRFEVGTGAGGNVVKPLKDISKFEYFSNEYDIKAKAAVAFDVFDIEVDIINNEIIDIYANLNEINDGITYGISFTNKKLNGEKKLASFTGQDIDDNENDKEIRIKNNNTVFSFSIRTSVNTNLTD